MNKICVLIASLSIVGCSSIPLNPGAEKVRLTKMDPGKECTFLGEATGNQGNFVTGSWTSNANLEIGAKNALKNNAAAMGGNVVALLTDRAAQSGQNGGSEQVSVFLSGNVYKCPE